MRIGSEREIKRLMTLAQNFEDESISLRKQLGQSQKAARDLERSNMEVEAARDEETRKFEK